MPSDNSLTDQQLKEMLANGSTRRAGFERMVKEYSSQLYWQVRRIVLFHDDADDVLQNTFLKAWNALDSFHGESKVQTWLSRIAINESIDFLRKKQRFTVVSADADEAQSLSRRLMADDYFDGSEAEAKLQAAIAMLPDVQRTVFTLRYFDDMKYSDMSQVLGTSEGALKASYHIAVKKISEYIRKTD